ncbi:rod shape-determining protein MreC [Elstera sp.]|jgi:rod shape-determining protein MreC|uniref:rod shape-determining protein MreC n=1 Tax=Elstera sp. TaxID=1916664 RepID=UPI0037C03525
MKPRVGSVSRLAAPVRAALHRFAFASLIAASFLLLIIQRAEVPVFERLRVITVDFFAPIVDILGSPVTSASEFAEDLRSVFNLRAENALLKAEVERLRQWRDVAQRLDVENQSLRNLTNYAPPPGGRQITGRVVADAGGAYVRNLLIAVGSNQGVMRGLAAVSGEGFIGRVTDVGERTTRVLLITDLNSKIPVAVGPRGERAVLAGDNSALPRLLYLTQENNVAPGDIVVTSGHGGLLPPGLPIGAVETVSDRAVTVRPLADWQRINHVRLLDYGLTQIQAGDLPASAPPPRTVTTPR